jgi:hypothetical protein
MRNPRSRVAAAAFCTVVAGAGLTACAQGSNPPSDFCKSVAGISSNLDQIQQTPISKAGLPTLQTQLTQLNEDTKSLAENTDPTYQKQADAVVQAAVPLKADVQAAVADPSNAHYRAVQSSLATYSSAVGDLTSATSSSC